MLQQACQALEAYAGLFKFLIGKTWVLAGEPLELPSYVRGNIFRRLNDDYVVTMVSDDRSIFDDLPARRDVTILVRIPDADKYTEAEVYSADYQGARPARINRDGKAVMGEKGPDRWAEEEATLTGPRGTRPDQTDRQDRTLTLTIPQHKSASLVVLKRTKG